MKKLRILLIFFTVLAIASAATGVLAQDTKPEPCPEATFIGPPAELNVNEIGDYSVVVDLKGIYQEILFEWSTTGGDVVEGQGISNAKIKRTSDDFSVSVRIRGRRPRCEQVHRFRTFEPDLTPPEAIMLDRIVGKVLADIDEGKIKRFVETTRTDRTHVFWVILGFNKTGGAGEVADRRRFLLDSFEKNGRVGHDVRITLVDVEADEDFIEFWKTTANARPSILDK